MKSSNNLISIGLPTFNNAEYISTALDYLLVQTYRNIEIVISDNASNDDTQKICQRYVKKDRRIRYIRQKRNIGMVNNFNFVLNKAKGAYFMWASSDDFWHKNFIKILVTLLRKNPDAVLAMCNFDNVHNGRHFHNRPSGIVGQTTKFTSLLNFIKKGDLSYFYGLHKTQNLKKVGGYVPSSRPFFKSSDYATIFKVLTLGRMVYTNEVLFSKRDTGLHFARYKIFKNLNFNKKVLRTILRYSFFPLFFIYNLLIATKYTLFSDFNFKQKVILFFNIFISYFTNHVGFLHNVSSGIFYLFMGIGIKLRKVL